jgi:two-component system response regulator RegA
MTVATASPDAAPFGLIVDDDALYLRTLRRALERRGVATAGAGDADEALRVARERVPDFALLDLKLGTQSGIALIEPLRALRRDMRIFLVTGYASVATAVEAIKRGADDYLPKPASAAAILRALGIACRDHLDEDDADGATARMTPLHRLEWEHIQQALLESQGNVSEAARLLGMHRRSLQRKLAKRPGPERRPE